MRTRTVLTIIFISLVCFDGVILAQEKDLYEEMMLFSDVISHVRAGYMDEVDPPELIRAAIDGVLFHLDPHTVYLDPHQYESLLRIVSGEAIGLGIELDIIDEVPTVISTLKGSSAGRSTVRTGDMLLRVDGQEVVGLSEPKLRLLLSGPEGTKVELIFKRVDVDENYTVTLERNKIRIPTVLGFMLPPEIGYIRISRFSSRTANEFAKALRKVKKQRMRGLVLDLRDNPGGLMIAAEEIADMFIPEGKIIIETRGRKQMACDTIYASGRKKEAPYPMIVMINEGSASASEVLAGSLQDHDRALIVGGNSFGKALIQQRFLLNDGGALLMSVARYYTPSGRQIQRAYKELKTEEDVGLFKTEGGREVHGGPGIVPDVATEASSDPLSDIEKIRTNSSLSEFIVQLARKNRGKWKRFEDYRAEFDVSPGVVDDFIQLVRDSDVDVSFVAQNRGHYRVLIKAEVARNLWGRDEASFVLIDYDPQLRSAIDHFPEAEEILKWMRDS